MLGTGEALCSPAQPLSFVPCHLQKAEGKPFQGQVDSVSPAGLCRRGLWGSRGQQEVQGPLLKGEQADGRERACSAPAWPPSALGLLLGKLKPIAGWVPLDAPPQIQGSAPLGQGLA